MNIRVLDPQLFAHTRNRLIQFLHLHGDRRITKKGMQWLKTADPGDLEKDGNLILVAVKDQKMKGILAISDYGRKESFVAVHRNERQQGIGVMLINHLLQHVDKAYGRVALDNIPSLKMCLAIGMVGFDLTTGPTGKPTLWLGVGNWSKEDVQYSHS